MSRTVFALGLLIPSLSAAPTFAQGGDITIFGGYAYPTYSQEFTFRTPSIPSFPGFEISEESTTLDAKGGTAFGLAAAFELGRVFGIEGRVDTASVKLESSGARYTLSGSGLSGSISLGEGPIPVDRLTLLSANLRLRIHGPVSLLASGGFSYLPSFNVGGSIPLTVGVPGLPAAGTTIPLRLTALPTDNEYRFGVNGGIGLRIRVAPVVALVGEVRGFYFSEYELYLQPANSALDDILRGLDPVRFNPVVVNAVAGVSFLF